MPPAAVTRRALVGLVLIGALALGIGGVASAQEPPPTSGVLVPGTTTPSVTTPPSSTSQAPAAEDEADEDSLLDLDANEKVWVIVGGLVAIAIVMMVLTVIYWRHTKPERPKQDRRIDRAERRAEKAERKDEKRQRKAASRDPFVVDDDADLDALIDEVDDEKDERTRRTRGRGRPAGGAARPGGPAGRPRLLPLGVRRPVGGRRAAPLGFSAWLTSSTSTP